MSQPAHRIFFIIDMKIRRSEQNKLIYQMCFYAVVHKMKYGEETSYFLGELPLKVDSARTSDILLPVLMPKY